MIEIDGSQGEGGGQVLRTSLALSMITSQPFRLYNLRAGRPRPGLQPQHLAAVRAAGAVGNAELKGAALGSRELIFRPSTIQAGEYHFSVGTAGSCMLVLQTVLPPLMLADRSSKVVLEGGTHNPYAPTFEFLTQSFLPQLEKIGPRVDLTLEGAGFYPAGGGRCIAKIHPAKQLQTTFNLSERGQLRNRRAVAMVARLPEQIARRELDAMGRILDWPNHSKSIQQIESPGPGNVLSLSAEFDHVTEVITAFGQKGIAAEQVAQRAARQMLEYLGSQAPVGVHLADQLLLPLALAGAGSFRCLRVTEHTKTNLEIVRKFLDLQISLETLPDQTTLIRIHSRHPLVTPGTNPRPEQECHTKISKQ